LDPRASATLKIRAYLKVFGLLRSSLQQTKKFYMSSLSSQS